MTLVTPRHRLIAALQAILLFISIVPRCDGSSSLSAGSREAPIWNDLMMQRIGAKVMGESALIDKETGRVFWEGGSQTSVVASIAPMISDLGVHGIKVTLLSIALFSCMLSLLARYVRMQLGNIAHPITRSTAMITFIASWTIFKLPYFDNWLVIAVVALYFLEAYNCDTRRYLANSILTPGEVEEYIERLRNEQPVVTWKVRCYHYELRAWANILLPQAVLRKLAQQQAASALSLPSFLTKKVVKHVAESNYVFKQCIDNTIAGLWKRAVASAALPPPFTKIKLTKLLILGNDKARLDYFQQQANFVTSEGQADEYAEFSTNISIHGFKPQLLAVRNVQGVLSTKLFRLHTFWILTILGLTIPFRIWFSRHCDELRVTVAKEALADTQQPVSKGWFGKSTSKTLGMNNPDFRQAMQHLSLYDTRESQDINVMETVLSSPASVSATKPKSWFKQSPTETDNLMTEQHDDIPQQESLKTPEVEAAKEDLDATALIEKDSVASEESLQLLEHHPVETTSKEASLTDQSNK